MSNANRRLCFVNIIIIAIAIGTVSCSSDGEGGDVPPAGTGGGTAAQGGVSGQAAGIGPTGQGGTAAGAAGTQAQGGAGGMGGSAGSAGEQMMDGGPIEDTDAEAPTVDCTQVPWENPGNVPIPDIELVPADAGKGEPAGHALNLEEYGYEEHEFLFSGTTPAFTSRFLVVRPSDPAKFSGTVYVEWYNVSGTVDVPVMWSASQEYFLREGHVHVGVSAQQVGADSLKTVDADRYASISHPGDGAANAIFSRAGAAIRAQPETILGECMVPRAVIAMGQSQSSVRLIDYLSNAAGADQVYDAILTHSGGTPAGDPPVPVFVVRTMNEGNANSSGPNLVEWDIAGASHNDKRLTERSFDIVGAAYGFDEIPFTCLNPMNDFPAYRAYNAVLDWMSRWVRDGERPPEGAPFEMAGTAYALDEVGNMKGGVRLPDIDAPTKVYSADNGPAQGADLFTTLLGGLACGLAGTAVPLSAQELMALYPTHEDYVQKYVEAADRARMSGFLLQEDYDEMIELAKAAPVPN
jgi:hypothetical protein